MSEALAEALDLSLALKRVKLDIKYGRVFFEHPFELGLVEIDETQWIADLRESIRSGAFQLGSLTICDVPKAKGHVRPGGCLSLADQVYYTAVVGACLPAIITGTSSKSQHVDFSYRLNGKTTSPEWLLNPFVGWDRFRRASLERITQSAAYVVVADVAGYYETISIRRLLSDLRQHGVSNLIGKALNDCLNGWARIRDRGIPQGFSASDILGKLYLSAVDRTYAEMGFAHYRYVDDFRVFCRTRAEARSAIAALTRLLRERGLVFQSSKTAICTADEARAMIDGVAPRIEEIRCDYLREISRSSGQASGYMSLGAADARFSKHPDDAPVEVIERAYSEYVLGVGAVFDKTLFHFLLKRLGLAKSRLAVNHTVQLLSEHPEETKAILRYWSALGVTAECDQAIVTFLDSQDAVYHYQLYELLVWRASIGAPATGDLLRIARRHCFESSAPPFLRAVCRRFLAAFGTLGDISRIQEQYHTAGTPLEKSELLCCLARLEPASRNAFLKAASNHSDFARRADRAVRQGLFELTGRPAA